MSQVFEDQTEDTFSLERFTDNCLPKKEKKSVPRSNGDAVDAVYDRKIPPRFFFKKKNPQGTKIQSYICIEFLSFFEKGR